MLSRSAASRSPAPLGLRPCDVVLLRATPPDPKGVPRPGLRSEPGPGGTPSASGFAVAPNLAVMVLAPVPGALQLLDLAPDQLALERADVGDVQSPIEVLGLVQERARQQIFRGPLEHLAPGVLRPYGDAAAAPHLLAKPGNTQT